MQCANQCAGYTYMGMQWGNECFCDNDYGDQGTREIGECDTDGEVLGFPDYANRAGTGENGPAGWTNAVYDIIYGDAPPLG